MALVNNDSKKQSLSSMIQNLSATQREVNALKAGQPTQAAQSQPYQSSPAQATSSGSKLTEAIQKLSTTQGEVDALKNAYKGQIESSKKGIDTKSVDSQTTQQFFDYQTRYNNYYYNMANEVLGVLKDTAERETALGDIKKIAQYKATDDILSAFGTTGGNLTRYNDVDPVQIVFYNIYKDRADAAGVSVDEKTGVAKSNGTIDQTEATYAINQMDWLTPHEKAVLWQSTNSSWKVKNNPWGAYL